MTFLVPSQGKFVPGSFVQPGKPVGVMVQDKDQDTDNLVSNDTVTVTLRTSPSGDEETFMLEEKLEPGVFIAPITVEYGIPIKGDGKVQVLGGDNLVLLYRDANNLTPGRSVTRQVTAEIRDAGVIQFSRGPNPQDPFTAVITAPGTIFVRLTDHDLDTDGLPDTDSASARITTLKGDSETVTLRETEPGFFLGIIESRTGLAAPGDNILQIRGGDEVTATYVDNKAPESASDATRSITALAAFNAEIYSVGVRANAPDVSYGFLPIDGVGKIVIYDPDEDTDGKVSRDSVTASVRTSTGDMETVNFVETQEPGRFVGEINTRSGLSEPSNGWLELTGGDEIAVEYLDKNNFDPWTAVTRQVFLMPASDAVVAMNLVWDGDNAPKGLIPGGEFEVTVTDLDRDKDLKPQTDSIEITVTTTLGDEEKITLNEDEIPGQFKGRIKSQGGKPAPGNGIVEISGSDQVLAAYFDEARSLDAQPTLTASVPVVSDGMLMIARKWGEAPVDRINETGQYNLFLTDWNLDTDGLPNTDSAKVNAATTLGDSEELILKETEPGVFTAPILLAYGEKVPGNGTIEIVGIDIVEFTYLDEVSAESLGPTLKRAAAEVAYDAELRILPPPGSGDKPGDIEIDKAVTLQVVDPDMDTDGIAGTDTVTVELKTTSGDRELVTLNEIFPGFFEGKIDSSYGSFAADNAVLEYVSLDTIDAGYNDLETLTGPRPDVKTAAARPVQTGTLLALQSPQGERPMTAVFSKQKIYLRVVDRDSDTDGKPFTDQIQVRLKTTAGDEETVTLSETADAGIFSWFIPVDYGQWFDKDGVLQVNTEDKVEITYKELTDRLTGQTLVHSEEIPVESRGQVFLVMLGALEVGRIKTGGMLDPIFADDEFQRGFYSNGRMAFFLKGKIKGKYLVTASYDSEKPTSRNQFYQNLSPEQYYPIYGDTSTQGWEANTSGKLYVKVTREQATVLLGDITTDITQGDFAAYPRTLQGVKLSYNGSDFDIYAFGALSKRVGARDEMQGQGTSGVYYICRSSLKNLLPLEDPFEQYPVTNPNEFGRGYYDTTCDETQVDAMVANSEKVAIEVRDRDHRDILLERKILNRYENYEVDYQERTLTFKEPIGSFDAGGNPVYIVVDYEYAPMGGMGQDYYAGAAVTLKGANGRTVTVSQILENKVENYSLTGVSASLPFGSKFKIDGEFALSDASARGQAYQLSAQLKPSEKMEFTAYYRDVDSDFSNDFTTLLRTATKHLALTSTFHLTRNLKVMASKHDFESVEPTTGAVTENTYTQGDVQYTRGRASMTGSLERRKSETGGNSATEGRSRLGVQYKTSSRLTLAAEQEFRDKPKNVAGPESLSAVQATYRYDEKTSTTIRHQWYDQGNPGTFVGVQTELNTGDSPKRNAYVKYQLSSTASGTRNQMLVGLDNKYKVGHYATANIHYEKALAIGSQSDEPDALSIGVELLPHDDMVGSARYEIRRQGGTTMRLFTFAGDGKITDEVSLLSKYRYLSSGQDNSLKRDILFALSYRTLNEDTISALGSLEYRYRRMPLFTKTVWLGSLEGVYAINRHTDLSARYAFKEADSVYLDGVRVKTNASLMLTRLTYKRRQRWEGSFEYSLLRQKQTRSMLRGMALEVGYTFHEFDNRWKLIVGRAWLDYFDEDFFENEYWRRGWYLRLVYKY